MRRFIRGAPSVVRGRRPGIAAFGGRHELDRCRVARRRHPRRAGDLYPNAPGSDAGSPFLRCTHPAARGSRSRGLRAVVRRTARTQSGARHRDGGRITRSVRVGGRHRRWLRGRRPGLARGSTGRRLGKSSAVAPRGGRGRRRRGGYPFTPLQSRRRSHAAGLRVRPVVASALDLALGLRCGYGAHRAARGQHTVALVGGHDLDFGHRVPRAGPTDPRGPDV